MAIDRANPDSADEVFQILIPDKSDKKVTIVVATHGIIKKTQKTPKKEIDKATQIMKSYFDSKENKDKK